ncbi:MAG: FecR family protein [Gammaproteobacteria bacterium]
MTNTSPCRTFAAALALAAALSFAAAADAKEAGKALFVAGTVTVERTPPVALKQGDAVHTGDTIATGDKSRAQIVMNDGARVALRANSRYRVDQFGLPASVGAQATATQAEGITVATLLKGGFRSSTGAIGKDGKGTYEVRTPIGTLGIRGTDYTAVWCQGDCADVPAVPAPQNGMYLAVHGGAIVFRYGGREAVVAAGETIFIAATDALPVPLDQVPDWLTTDGAGPLVTGARDDAPKGQVALPDLGSSAPPTGQQPPGTSAPDPQDPEGKQGVQRPVTGTVGGQVPIDLTRGDFDVRNPNSPGTPSVPPPGNSAPPPNAPPTGAPPPTTHVPPPPPPSNNVPPPPPGGN